MSLHTNTESEAVVRLKVRRIIVTPLIIALTALLAAFGCASDNSSALILEEATEVWMTDVKAMQEANTALAQRLDTQFGNWKSNNFVNASYINWIWEVHTAPSGNYPSAYYKAVMGDFDAQTFRDMKKRPRGFRTTTHYGRSIWDGPSGRTLAFLENSKSYVDGDRNVVRKISRLLSQEDEGFMQSSSDLRQAMDKVRGGALRMVASTDCSISFYTSNTTGCRASAIAVTGGDKDATDFKFVALFRNESRAETAQEDVEEALEEAMDAGIDMDIHQIDRSDEIVTFEITIHR